MFLLSFAIVTRGTLYIFHLRALLEKGEKIFRFNKHRVPNKRLVLNIRENTVYKYLCKILSISEPHTGQTNNILHRVGSGVLKVLL